VHWLTLIVDEAVDFLELGFQEFGELRYSSNCSFLGWTVK
jgi:hypothetical protein